MILGRALLEKRIKEENLIENYCEDCLESCGYDLRVKTFYDASGEAAMKLSGRVMPEVKEIPENEIVLKPGDYVLMETIEKINMPKDLAARVLNKSSLFRCGASTFNALVDPGFCGTLTFGLKNISTHDFVVEKGVKIAQIVFEEVGGGVVPYSGRFQGGKII